MPSLHSPSHLLCYGIGNVSRGDDALGPKLLRWLANNCDSFSNYHFSLESPFQLQPENIYEFKDHDAILFLDADVRFHTGVKFKELTAASNNNPFISHALSPEQLLSMHNDLLKHHHPKAFLLSMGAVNMALEESISAQAKSNLRIAKKILSGLLTQPVSKWQA